MHARPQHLTLSFSSSISIAGSKKSSWMNVIYFRRSPSRLFMLPPVCSGGGIMFSTGPFVRPSVRPFVCYQSWEHDIFTKEPTNFAANSHNVVHGSRTRNSQLRESGGQVQGHWRPQFYLELGLAETSCSLDPLSPYTANRYGQNRYSIRNSCCLLYASFRRRSVNKCHILCHSTFGV